MAISDAASGGLFAPDYLQESIAELPEWQALGDARVDEFAAAARRLAAPFHAPNASPNESHTEADLIWPLLEQLGWTASLRQQNLSAAGRENVPDGLLFADGAAKARALEVAEGPARYAIGTALLESKRWLRPLDRGSGHRGETLAPSSQMLRYLRRADDLTDGGVRWGILTNGAQWRLYYQGARSVANQFFEIDLAAALALPTLPARDEGLFRLDEEERRHALRLFMVFFGRDAFVLRDASARNLHERALLQGRYDEQRIASDMSQLVFERVFPNLAKAIAGAAPEAPLGEVREATLVLLYRMLFILYAEDRQLLPMRDDGYANISFRQRVRDDVRRRKERGLPFSETVCGYYHTLMDLARVIDRGDPAFGLPPYNGGLFDPAAALLLERIRLPNACLAEVVDALSFEQPSRGERRYLNYRSLSVQQLGSIYERLLEHEVVRDADGAVGVRPNAFARKGSGSYYTPDELVRLVLAEAVEPLVADRLAAFRAAVAAGGRAAAAAADPARAILQMKVCDPAMGSGHFLVNLVDHLGDHVIAALAEAEDALPGYASPVLAEVEAARRTIRDNARREGWHVAPGHLDDRQILRRMVLKRCVYGVDKNPMAVELAKVSLWLHTFTIGVPLGFLDHHLRWGDSLFGCDVGAAIEHAESAGGALFVRGPLERALAAAKPMRLLEALADVEIDEADRSAALFGKVEQGIAPLSEFLSALHALEWLQPDDKGRAAVRSWLGGAFGDPLAFLAGEEAGDAPGRGSPEAARCARLLGEARQLAAEERFLHWQVAFPGVWSEWDVPLADGGGFDAVVGNPPWDRMKMQQVEWFAARRPAIASTQKAADRKRMIRSLVAGGDPLGAEFGRADSRAAAALRVVRGGQDYPLLGRGDINLYSLFVERAMTLAKPDGVIGLLTPSGIASDHTAARFFRAVATKGRLRALYDFENRRPRFKQPSFFPDVHSSFKFCAFVAGRSPQAQAARCAFFLQGVSEIEDRQFPLSAEDFACVNPDTGTAPVFRSSRDAALTVGVYQRMPTLMGPADTSGPRARGHWRLRYRRMFDLTNDSSLFRTRQELVEKEGAWPVAGNVFDSPGGRWLPLYEGKMVQAFDHRAAGVTVNLANPHRPASPVAATLDQHGDPNWSPTPQYWIEGTGLEAWAVAFKDVTAPTNARSMVAAVVPYRTAGNTLPLLVAEDLCPQRMAHLVANLNAIAYDFFARQKIHGQHLNLFVVKQLPTVPPDRYEEIRFGSKTAADVIREAVLELTYTAHDMAHFARDLGYVDASGDPRPPFPWDPERRLRLRAKLDAAYFLLYGIDRWEDVAYIYSTFPIVERRQAAAYGSYRSRDLCGAWMNALAAGEPDAEVAG